MIAETIQQTEIVMDYPQLAGNCRQDKASVGVTSIDDPSITLTNQWGMCPEDERLGWRMRTWDLSQLAGERVLLSIRGGYFWGDYLAVDDFAWIAP